MKKAWMNPEATKLDVKLTLNTYDDGFGDFWKNEDDPTLDPLETHQDNYK